MGFLWNRQFSCGHFYLSQSKDNYTDIPVLLPHKKHIVGSVQTEVIMKDLISSPSCFLKWNRPSLIKAADETMKTNRICAISSNRESISTGKIQWSNHLNFEFSILYYHKIKWITWYYIIKFNSKLIYDKFTNKKYTEIDNNCSMCKQGIWQGIET